MQSLQQTSILIGILYLTTVYPIQAQPVCKQESNTNIARVGSEYVDFGVFGVADADACCTLCHASPGLPRCIAFVYYHGSQYCVRLTKLPTIEIQTIVVCSDPCTSGFITAGCKHKADVNIDAGKGGSVMLTIYDIVDADTCCIHCKGHMPRCVAYVYYHSNENCYLIDKLGPIQRLPGITSGFMTACPNDLRVETGMWGAAWIQGRYDNIAGMEECCDKCKHDCIAFVYDSDEKKCFTSANPGPEQPNLPTQTLVYAKTKKGYYKHYIVTLTTGDEPEAGTDSKEHVKIQFIGFHGIYTRLMWLESDVDLRDDKYDKFERNSVNVFHLYAKDIGKLSAVIITKEHSATNEKWKLDTLNVTVHGDKVSAFGVFSTVPDLQYSIPFNKWLEGENIEATLYIMHIFKLWVTTANEAEAGTDDYVYFKFRGETGITNEVMLDELPDKDDFALGATDMYTAYFSNVGKLLSATVRTKRYEQNQDAWKLSTVVVEIIGHVTYTFDFNMWINEDASSTVELTPCAKDVRAERGMWRAAWIQGRYDNIAGVDECCDKCKGDCIAFVYDSDEKKCFTSANPGPEQPNISTQTLVYTKKGYYKHYTVTLTTADEPEAGTDSKEHVKIQFIGEGGEKTRLMWLESALDSKDDKFDKFERNSVNVFQLYAKDIGKLTAVRVTKEHSTRNEKWKLDSLNVTVHRDKLSTTTEAAALIGPVGAVVSVVETGDIQYSILCNKWLEGKNIEVTLYIMISYKLWVTTGNETETGTWDHIYIKFRGETGITNEVLLWNQGVAYGENTAQFNNVGKLLAATVRTEEFRPNKHPWKLSTVVVEGADHGTYTFNFNMWINENISATVELPVPTNVSNTTLHEQKKEPEPTESAATFPPWAIGVTVGLAGLLLILVAVVLMRKRRAPAPPPPSDASKTANIPTEQELQELETADKEKPADNATVLPPAGQDVATADLFGKKPKTKPKTETEGAETAESASETGSASASADVESDTKHI